MSSAAIDALIAQGLSAREIGRRLKVDARTVSARAKSYHRDLKCGCGLSWFHSGRCHFRRANDARAKPIARMDVEIITADVLGDPPAHRSGLAQKSASA